MKHFSSFWDSAESMIWVTQCLSNTNLMLHKSSSFCDDSEDTHTLQCPGIITTVTWTISSHQAEQRVQMVQSIRLKLYCPYDTLQVLF